MICARLMTMDELVKRLITLYPQIFMACHTGHGPESSIRRELTSRQILILEHLDASEPMNLRDLARHLGVTPATMSAAVDRLARKDLVIHERSARDRREIELRLSPKGAKIIESGSVLDAARVEKMLALLAEDDRQAALAGLELLAEAASQLEATSSK